MSIFAKYVGGQSQSGGGSSGTVTSVGLSAPSIFTVSGSPVTTAGTLALALAPENANTVFAGPSSGSPSAPTFRMLTVSDIPSLSYVSSVSASSPLSSSGGLTPTISISQATTSTNGYLSSTDWNTFNNKQPSGNYAVGSSPTVVNEIATWNNTSGTSLVSSGLQAYYSSSYASMLIIPTNLSYPLSIATESNTIAEYIYIAAGNSSAGVGGGLYLESGAGTTSGGLLQIQAGNGSAGTGGAVNINAGTGTNAAGGAINLTAGIGNNAVGGAITIAAGNGYLSTGGQVQIVGGSTYGGGSNSPGGGVVIVGGTSAGTSSGSKVSITGGQASESGTGGELLLSAGSSTSGPSGNLVLTAGSGNSSSQSGAVTITTGSNSGSGYSGNMTFAIGSAASGINNSGGFLFVLNSTGGVYGELNGSQGAWTFGLSGGTQYHTINGSLLITNNVDISTPQTVLEGSSSGTLTVVQPFNGPSFKKVLIYCSSFSGTQTVNFPVPFIFTPVIMSTSGPSASVITSLSTASAVFTSSTSTTGFIILEGW